MAVSQSYNIILGLGIVFVFLPRLNLGLLSDYKICGDSECQSRMSRVQAIRDHRGKDCRYLSFRKGDTIFVYHKLTGKREDLWAGTIDRQFGYFPKDAVREEQLYATVGKVVETQESDFFCMDEFGYVIDSSHLDDDDNEDVDRAQNQEQETQTAPSVDDKNAESLSASEDVSIESAGSAQEAEGRTQEEPDKNTNPGDDPAGTQEGAQEDPAASKEQGGSASSPWLGSSVTGWLGLTKEEEPANVAERAKADAREEPQAEASSFSSSMTGWLGIGGGGGTTDNDVKEREDDGENAESITSTMTGWLGFGGEKKTENSAEKEDEEESKKDEEQEPAETFRSRRMSLDLEGSQLHEEEKKETGTMEWLGSGLSNKLGFGWTNQESESTESQVQETTEEEEQPASGSWYDMGIGDILGYNKEKIDESIGSGFQEPEDDETLDRPTGSERVDTSQLQPTLTEEVRTETIHESKIKEMTEDQNAQSETETVPGTTEPITTDSDNNNIGVSDRSKASDLPESEAAEAVGGMSSTPDSFLQIGRKEDDKEKAVIDNKTDNIVLVGERYAEIEGKDHQTSKAIKHEGDDNDRQTREEEIKTSSETDQDVLTQSHIDVLSNLNSDATGRSESGVEEDKTENLSGESAKIQSHIDESADLSVKISARKDEHDEGVNNEETDGLHREISETEGSAEHIQISSVAEESIVENHNQVSNEHETLTRIGSIANKESVSPDKQLITNQGEEDAQEQRESVKDTEIDVENNLQSVPTITTGIEKYALNESGPALFKDSDTETAIEEEDELNREREQMGIEELKKEQKQEELKEEEEIRAQEKQQEVDEEKQDMVKELKEEEQQQEVNEISEKGKPGQLEEEKEEKTQEEVEEVKEEGNQEDFEESKEDENQGKEEVKQDEIDEVKEEEKKQEVKEISEKAKLLELDELMEEKTQEDIEEIKEEGIQEEFGETKERQEEEATQDEMEELKEEEKQQEIKKISEKEKPLELKEEKTQGEIKDEGNQEEFGESKEEERQEEEKVTQDETEELKDEEKHGKVKDKQHQIEEIEEETQDEKSLETSLQTDERQTENPQVEEAEKDDENKQKELLHEVQDAKENVEGESRNKKEEGSKDDFIRARDVKDSTNEFNSKEEGVLMAGKPNPVFNMTEESQILSFKGTERDDDRLQEGGVKEDKRHDDIEADLNALGLNETENMQYTNNDLLHSVEVKVLSSQTTEVKENITELTGDKVLNQEVEANVEETGSKEISHEDKTEMKNGDNNKEEFIMKHDDEKLSDYADVKVTKCNQNTVGTELKTDGKIPPSEAFEAQAVISGQTAPQHSTGSPLRPDSPDDMKAEAESGGAFGLFKNAFSFFSQTPIAETKESTETTQSLDSYTFETSTSLTPEEEPDTAIDSSQVYIQDLLTDTSDNLLHKQPSPSLLQTPYSHPSSISLNAETPSQTKTLSKFYKNLLAFMSADDIDMLLDLFGRHKLQFLDDILGSSETMTGDPDTADSILLDVERLLHYHREMLVAPSKRLQDAPQEDKEKTKTLIALQKLEMLLAKVRETFSTGKQDTSNTSHQADGSCVGESCSTPSKDEKMEDESHKVEDSSVGQDTNTPKDEWMGWDKQSDKKIGGGTEEERVTKKEETGPPKKLEGVIQQTLDFVHKIAEDSSTHVHAARKLLIWLTVQSASLRSPTLNTP